VSTYIVSVAKPGNYCLTDDLVMMIV